MNDLISVVIPTYGRASSLQKSIESVITQTYSNLEVVVVDDNGENTECQIETKKMVSKMIKKDRRIKYVSHKINKNGSAARNTGINSSKGDFVCFLDDDDEFYGKKLEKQIKKLNSENYLACYCGHERFFEDNKKSVYYFQKLKEGDLKKECLNYSVDFCSGSTLMVKRSVINEIGGFNETLLRHQDYEFLVRIAFRGKIACVKEPLVRINVHQGSNIPKEFSKIEKYRLSYLKSVASYINQLNMNDQKEIYFENDYDLMKYSLKQKKPRKIFYYLRKCIINKFFIKRVYFDAKRIVKNAR